MTTTDRVIPEARPSRTVRRSRTFAWVLVAVFGSFTVLPIYWMIVTAITPTRQVFQFPPRLFPAEPTFEHFASLATNPDIIRYFGNSVFVSLVTAILTVLVASYTAYSFSKFRYRGRHALMYLILASQLFPQALILITLYLVFSALGLLDTYLVLILSFTSFTLPLCIWILKSFFDNIPDEILEAARVDGANQFTIIHRILLPIAAPGLLAAGLFAFMRGWNDFIFALTLTGEGRRTLPPGLVSTYMGEFQNVWPELMAASIVVSVPVVVVFIALQRHLVSGISSGAVKG